MTKNKEEQTLTTSFKLPEVLTLALGAITKEYGKGSVVQANSDTFVEMERLSSGCLSLDDALGGGFPRGRIVEIYGPESSGKTTTALCTIAEMHRNDPSALAAIVDAEHALDLQYAEKLGIDLERLFISQPDSAEEALNITDALVRTGTFGIIVVDSVAALVPKKELEGEVGDAVMGLQARLMGQALRKVTGVTSNTNTLLIFINQLRMKIGVIFGNPETTAGGNALKFYASIRLDIRRIGNDKVGDDVTASTTRVKVVKNKTAAPYKVAEFKIKYGEGIDVLDDLIEKAVSKGIVVKAGAWVKYKGENYSGQNGFETFIKSTEGALAALKSEVLNAK